MKASVLSNKQQDLPDGRTNQDHCTTVELYQALERYRTIDCDPCSNPWSVIEARLCYSDHWGQNGLELEWSPDGLTYLNPPFGNLMPWILAANQQVADYPEAHVIMVCPFAPQTGWFRAAWDRRTEGLKPRASALAAWPRRIAWAGAGNRPAFTTAVVYWGSDVKGYQRWATSEECPIFGRVRVPRVRTATAKFVDRRQLPLPEVQL